ncbi:PAS domain-containing protein [Kineosporia sp. R_H_3]|uniref:PAS domain-containing protein n=1 Tax=Kineosporia sp. R_H_3 TaxID=1961848 RepID=UPI000B4BE7F8|nr:PAS domain-containing protein [Kineosporia sp. R_H_3]
MALTTAVQPTGAERVVLPDELFFSTTDRRGIIRAGNSVFSRISRYPLEELIGSPHNIVRHPDMPGGAFRVVWDRLLAGLPVAAYVENLAKDGSTYWVFATITPVRDGFLSVRTAPASPLYDPARRLMRAVREDERELARREGLGKAEVADAGALALERRLAELGFGSYDEFMLEALPAEVAARGDLVKNRFARPLATGPAADILLGATGLDNTLVDLVGRLDAYRALADALGESVGQVAGMARQLDRSVSVAQAASATVADTAPVLRNVAAVMAAPMGQAVGALDALAPRLQALREDVAQLRQQIALAQLHVDMVAAFAAECVDGAAPAASLADVPVLCDALRAGVEEVSSSALRVNTDLLEVGHLVETAGGLVDEFRGFLGQWRILVMRHRLGAALREHVGPIDDQLGATWDQLARLRELGAHCRRAVVTVDTAAMESELGLVRHAALRVAA